MATHKRAGWLVALVALATASAAARGADRESASALPGPGWVRVTIPDVGTIDMPPAMEVKAGFQEKLRRAYGEALEKHGEDGKTNLVLQQKGLNAVAPEASGYVRAIVSTQYGSPGEFAALDSRFTATAQELDEALAVVKSGMEGEGLEQYDKAQAAFVQKLQNMSDADFRVFMKEVLKARGRATDQVDAMSGAQLRRAREAFSERIQEEYRRPQAPRILEWMPVTLEDVNGVRAMRIAYRRQLGDNPPVFVRRYSFQNYDRMHHLILSYRESERLKWAADLEKVLRSFRITNIREAPAATGVGGIMSSRYGPDWVLVLIVSAVLTWGIGLSFPLLLRYAVTRRPLGWAAAFWTSAAWLLANVCIWTALGSRSSTHAALCLVAVVSYRILRAGSGKAAECAALEASDSDGAGSLPPPLSGRAVDQMGDRPTAPGAAPPKAKARTTTAIVWAVLAAGLLIAVVIAIAPGLPDTSQEPVAATPEAPRPRPDTQQRLVRSELPEGRRATEAPPARAAPPTITSPSPLSRTSPSAQLPSRGKSHTDAIQGKVLSANSATTPDFVALDVGRDDGVSVGMQFEVRRQGRRVAVVRVEVATPDFCAARIVERTGRPIQKGDSVRLLTDTE